MKHMNNKRTLVMIVLLLIFFNVCFIWWNSFQVSEVSNSVSDNIADVVKPIIDPIVEPITSEDGKIFGYKYNAFIRKMAHVFEFMILGALLFILRNIRHMHISTILFIALATAVTDETIQIFNGRSDSVKDIVIDFAGSLAGMLVTSIIFLIVRYMRERKK